MPIALPRTRIRGGVPVKRRKGAIVTYKEYAEQYGLGIDIIRWVFRHIRVTQYIGTEPVRYRISFKYSGRSVRCESQFFPTITL